MTLGQDVQILRAGETRLAHAIGIDEAGGLIVRYPDGTEGRRQLRRGLRPRDVWICLIFYRRN